MGKPLELFSLLNVAGYVSTKPAFSTPEVCYSTSLTFSPLPVTLLKTYSFEGLSFGEFRYSNSFFFGVI